MSKKEQEKAQEQQKVLNPHDFVDVDDLVFDMGSKETTLIGYKKMVKQIVSELQRTQKELNELKIRYEKDANIETHEKMKRKIDNLSNQNNEYREKVKYYIDKNKELNDVIDELLEKEEAQKEKKEGEESKVDPQKNSQIPRENKNKSKDKK